MRQRIYLTGAVVFFVISAMVSAYPFFARWYAGTMQGVVMQEYADAVRVVPSVERAEVFAEAVRYNEAMAQGHLSDEEGLHIADPFTFGSSLMPKGYFEQLATPDADGLMATIELASLGIKLPVYHGIDERVLHKGIGHVPQSALPVGGPGTHCVLAGHRGVPGSLLFTDLDKLGIGDKFLIHVLDRTLTYEVHSLKTVLPDDVSTLAPVPGRDLMTLSTCTPLGVNSHRLLVHAHRVADTPLAITWPDANTLQLLIVGAILLTLGALCTLVWWLDHRFLHAFKRSAAEIDFASIRAADRSPNGE
jgi:sortase A